MGLARPRRRDPRRGAQRRRPRRAAPARSRRCAARGSARTGSSRATRPARSRARHRRPLRPRQRALRADARPDAELLVHRLRAPRRDARGGRARQARPRLREARPRPARPRARDRQRLGRLRAPRGGDAADAASRRRRCPASSTRSPSRGSATAGLEDRVTVLLDDYRDLRGSYDKLVSIEMIEAVGWRDFGTLFARCSDLLRPDGAMLLQAITIDDRAYEVEKASRSFMRTHIFPNGCLPSLEVIARCVARRHRPAHGRPRGPHAALRRDDRAAGARTSSARRSALDGARLRRALPADVAACTSPTARAGSPSAASAVVQTVLAKPHWRGSVRAGVTAPPPALTPIAAAG